MSHAEIAKELEDVRALFEKTLKELKEALSRREEKGLTDFGISFDRGLQIGHANRIIEKAERCLKSKA